MHIEHPQPLGKNQTPYQTILLLKHPLPPVCWRSAGICPHFFDSSTKLPAHSVLKYIFQTTIELVLAP
jgi:hypothetical protein